MKQFIKYITIVFVIMLVAASLVMVFQSPFSKADSIPLSDVVAKINAGQVKEITGKGDALDIVLKDDKKIVSQKEPGISAFESLLNLGADKAKPSTLNIDVKDSSGMIKKQKRTMKKS